MLERLRLTTNPAPTNIQRHPRGRPQDGRVHKNKRARQGSQANVPKEQSDAETHSSDEERQSNVDSAVDFEPRIFHDAVFSPTQKSAIQETVSSSVNEGFLRVFESHKAQVRFSDDPRTPRPRILNTATPLGLHRPLEKSLEDNVLLARTIRRRIAPTRARAGRLTAKPLSALTTTNPLAVNAVPAISRTVAVAGARATTPSSTALVPKQSGSSNRPANPSDRNQK